MQISQKIPKMIIISGPSGSGKTTIYKKILEKYSEDFIVSISCTTRDPRPGEKNGIDYFFLEKEEFQQKISENFFLEFAEVHGNFYGTPKDFVFEKLENGKNVLFDIDWQGALQIKENCKEFDGQKFEIILIFLLPPSLEELQKRLENRGLDSNQVIEKRIQGAKVEIEKFNQYDYVIFNKNIEQTFENIEKIIHDDLIFRKSHDSKRPELQNKVKETFLL